MSDVMRQTIIELREENGRLREQLVKATDPKAMKKAIDATFSAQGLYIDWQLRDAVVKAILSYPDDK